MGGALRRVLTHGEAPSLVALCEEILDKADAVVGEDRRALVLRGIEVDVGHDAEVAVAGIVREDLVHVPDVLGLLIGLIDGEKCR